MSAELRGQVGMQSHRQVQALRRERSPNAAAQVLAAGARVPLPLAVAGEALRSLHRNRQRRAPRPRLSAQRSLLNLHRLEVAVGVTEARAAVAAGVAGAVAAVVAVAAAVAQAREAASLAARPST